MNDWRCNRKVFNGIQSFPPYIASKYSQPHFMASCYCSAIFKAMWRQVRKREKWRQVHTGLTINQVLVVLWFQEPLNQFTSCQTTWHCSPLNVSTCQSGAFDPDRAEPLSDHFSLWIIVESKAWRSKSHVVPSRIKQNQAKVLHETTYNTLWEVTCYLESSRETICHSQWFQFN